MTELDVFKPGAVADVSAVVRLQDELLKMPQADIKTIHTFKPGIYERTIVVPPWTVITGAAHKTAFKVRLEKGKTEYLTENGLVYKEAPYEFEAPAGLQRAGYTFDEEMIWTDVYENPDDCKDLAVLEDRLYVIPECGLGETRALLSRTLELGA